ncbi:MAG: ATP-binding protein [Pseudomonadales bacterium]|nr:ATP-binding protein [Pseudomonadales bacterium]MDP7595898.1 ATP-binding protein [Pseudomonadales bacterium]
MRSYLERFPVVAVIGARQVGKSTLIQKIWPAVRQFDLENVRHLDLIEEDVEFFLAQNPAPISLDEAQLSDALFKGIRVAVDRNRSQAGQYLISGSSSPTLLKNISESLAGRIAIYELNPLTFEDALGLQPSPFYSLLIEQDLDAIAGLKPRYTRAQLFDLSFNGGYPEHYLKRQDAIFHHQWMDNYIRTYIDRDIRALFPNLQLAVYRRFIRMLATSSGQLINASQFARSLDVSQPTIKKYLEIAEGTFLWRSLPSFQSNRRKRVIKMPKGHFRDSGLVCGLLNIYSQDAWLNHPNFGQIWESFIIEQVINSLKIRLQSFQYYFYRTQHQAEIDLVVEGEFGLIPFEIKTGFRTSAKKLRHLNTFIKEHNCPVGFVVNNSERVEKLADKIIQLPASCL